MILIKNIVFANIKKNFSKKIDFRLEIYMFCAYLKWLEFLTNQYCYVILIKTYIFGMKIIILIINCSLKFD